MTSALRCLSRLKGRSGTTAADGCELLGLSGFGGWRVFEYQQWDRGAGGPASCEQGLELFVEGDLQSSERGLGDCSHVQSGLKLIVPQSERLCDFCDFIDAGVVCELLCTVGGNVFQKCLFLQGEQQSPFAIAKPKDLPGDDGGTVAEVSGAV